MKTTITLITILTMTLAILMTLNKELGFFKTVSHPMAIKIMITLQNIYLAILIQKHKEILQDWA